MLGLYIHFPYCLRRCPYCDFAVSVTREVPEARYARAVLAELALRLGDGPHAYGPVRRGNHRPLTSIYFGGGTPSLWAPPHVAAVLAGVRSRLSVAADAEVTLEANPERLDEARLSGYRAAGVNRLSLGVQSFGEDRLRALGRAHDGPQARQAFATARAAGFDNVTLDLIYGVQGETVAQAQEDATRALELAPDHVSAYALTLDPESLAEPVRLSRRVARGEVVLPGDAQVVEMADAVARTLEAGGLRQYEISNFARDGRRSRHNTLYWHGQDCLALGCGAVGFGRDGSSAAERYGNLRRVEDYLEAVEAGRAPEAERETLDAASLGTERVMTGLRLVEGLDLRATLAELGLPWGGRDQALGRMKAEGLVREEAGRISLTPRGRHLHSAIAAALA